MIMVDTSVWIDYLNGLDNLHTAKLDEALAQGTVAIGDVIFLEILQGVRKDDEFRKTKIRLTSLDRYEMFGHWIVGKCAENYRRLRKKGITIRSTMDVIIATFCIENNLPLLFKDKDFIPFVGHLSLSPVSVET
jgi:predicted nucleic acid-binding protein